MGKEIGHKDVRSISMGHYSILYKFNSERIIIVAFWDNRQDPRKVHDSLKNL